MSKPCPFNALGPHVAQDKKTEEAVESVSLLCSVDQDCLHFMHKHNFRFDSPEFALECLLCLLVLSAFQRSLLPKYSVSSNVVFRICMISCDFVFQATWSRLRDIYIALTKRCTAIARQHKISSCGDAEVADVQT